MSSHMTPEEIVSELDKNIVGQEAAKRAVAIALRNRWRRQQVPEPLRQEITPKNILMIGPTGVGKTEIARRLARLADAPFVKVEATKFTEVGYVGRDVDTIIRDLVEVAVKEMREAETRKVRDRAADNAEERLLDVLLPPAREVNFEDLKPTDSATRQKFRKMLREGALDDREVEIEVATMPAQMEIMAPPGMEELTSQIQGMFQQMGSGHRELKKMSVAEAMKQLTDEEAARLLNDDDIKSKALAAAEQNGIVFLDEMDKVASRALGDARRRRVAARRAARPAADRRRHDGGDQIRDGQDRSHPVHRIGRLSPVETVGSHSGAPGRFPIRVELAPLSVSDFEKILTSSRAYLHAPVRGAARDRAGAPRLPAGRHQALGGDRVRRQREAGEYRRAAPSIRSWSDCSTMCRSTRRGAPGNRWQSTRRSSTPRLRISRATTTSRAIFFD